MPGNEIGPQEMQERFLDNQRIEGKYFRYAGRSNLVCEKNMKTKTIIHPEDGKREDRTDYPVTAIRGSSPERTDA